MFWKGDRAIMRLSRRPAAPSSNPNQPERTYVTIKRKSVACKALPATFMGAAGRGSPEWAYLAHIRGGRRFGARCNRSALRHCDFRLRSRGILSSRSRECRAPAPTNSPMQRSCGASLQRRTARRSCGHPRSSLPPTAAMTRKVSCRGVVTMSDPTVFVILDDRLFLFRSEAAKQRFLAQDGASSADAELAKASSWAASVEILPGAGNRRDPNSLRVATCSVCQLWPTSELLGGEKQRLAVRLRAEAPSARGPAIVSPRAMHLAGDSPAAAARRHT